MKKLFVLFALVGLFFVGCQDQITGPADTGTTQTSLSKKHGNNDLPSTLGTGAEYSVTQTVDGKKGGTIKFTHSRIGSNGVETANINVKFNKKAFEGSRDFTVTINYEDATITFTPHIEFDKNNAVTLDASFQGIDTEKLQFNKKRLDFYFFGDDGSKEPIKNNGVKFGKKDNSVSVKKAHLNHFSRYGWST